MFRFRNDWLATDAKEWVQIEISRVQPGKPGNFMPLVTFLFQYSSDTQNDQQDSKVELGLQLPPAYK